MDLKLRLRTYFIGMLLMVSGLGISQVGINTSSPASGALLDITHANGGFLTTRVALTGTNDVTTITPSATTGLLVYNTVTAGVLPFQVTPGFYYWDSVQWRRVYNQGYTLRYKQSEETAADNNPANYTDLDALDTGDMNIPFSGEYQLIVRGYLSAGDLNFVPTATDPDGACIGSISLWMDTNNSGTFTKLEESFLTASSKTVSSTTDFDNMANSTTIVYNVTLDVVNSYRFKVMGREWDRNGVDVGTFGRETNVYLGALGITDAQLGTMTFTLIRQQ